MYYPIQKKLVKENLIIDLNDINKIETNGIINQSAILHSKNGENIIAENVRSKKIY